MANTQAMCTSFMGELLTATHDFTPSTGDSFKALLVLSSATVNASQTNVGTPGTGTPSTSNIGTNEVSGTGYTAGGIAVTNGTAPASTNTSAKAGVA